MTSWAVSRKPSPVRPPTSTNEAKRDHTTHVSAWRRVQVFSIAFMPADGVFTASTAFLRRQYSARSANAASTLAGFE